MAEGHPAFTDRTIPVISGNGESHIPWETDRSDRTGGGKTMPPKAMVGEHGLCDAAAWVWCDHGHDGAGSHRRGWTLRNTKEAGELFGIDTGFGAERDQVPGQGDHEGRAPWIEMGLGGSGTTGGEVGPVVEDEVCSIAETHASQPGNRCDRTSSVGVGMVCVDSSPALSRFHTRTDRL